jgi:hypothetical protein
MSMALRFWGARRAASPVRRGSLSSSRLGVKAAVRVSSIEAVAEAIGRVKSERFCGVSRMEVRDWSSEEGEGERWRSAED